MNARHNHLFVLLSALSATFYGCAKAPSTPASPPVVTGLAVEQVHSAQIPLRIDAVGTVHSRESAVLSSQVMRRVTSILVHEGDQVRAGQLLVTLDNAQSTSDVERAHANISSSVEELKIAETESDLAKSTLARYQLLRDRKSVSPQEFDEVQRRSETAAGHVEAARSRLQGAKSAEASARTVSGYSRLYSPFSGTVTARRVDPGTMAIPGTPLIEVEKKGVLQLHVNVDESLLPLLHDGLQIPVTLDTLSKESLQGRISQIIPAADPTSHSFLVKIDLPAVAGMRSGMFGTAGIETKDRSTLLVPQSAVVNHGSLASLWVLDQNHVASLRYITLGAKNGTNYEVLSGLAAGETVVLSPGDRELGGKRIEVSQ
ncbi:MAG TPA: efflux RND transporter periplasmic adaptor subunit [Acidisarcina sp.]|nr:efflux RND transporter periplasmic adaptor subunit [Acidisarcina sp.]